MRLFPTLLVLAMTTLMTSAINPPALPTEDIFYIGTGNDSIHTAAFDPLTGDIRLLSSISGVGQASWQQPSHSGKTLYSIDEAGGRFEVFNIHSDGSLSRQQQLPTITGAVSIAISKDDKEIFLAHYMGNAVSYLTVDTTGTVTLSKNWTFTAPPGPKQPNQDKPHPHQVLYDPSGKWVIVPDLGADLLRVFNSQGETQQIKMPPGSGPRHGVFWEGFYYLVSELVSTVTVFKVESTEKKFLLRELQTIPTLPDGMRKNAAAAEILVTQDGGFVYVSNRWEEMFKDGNAITGFVRNQTTGMLAPMTPQQYFPSMVRTPRHVALWPGKGEGYFFAEGQDGGGVVVFKRDQKTGAIMNAESSLQVVQPMCITWRPKAKAEKGDKKEAGSRKPRRGL
ncbi:Lactonase, 7-bladed beta-propeller-domain-containing protein [Pyronema omphalodes]|nr:Lactonase, 7-bladed beta-propeller-domain-containing protein [Pyronema omphalodes]